MQKLYDLGYLEIKKLELVKKVVDELDGLIYDIRFNPHSSDPQWEINWLTQHLNDPQSGQHYAHLKDLGNKNYQNDGPTEFVSLDSGIATVVQSLETQAVIVMCACWERRLCHRLEVVRIIQEKYGVESIPLTVEKCWEILKISQPRQPGLF